MKTILVLWIVTSSGVAMTTRSTPNMDACETAGRVWQGADLHVTNAWHGYQCLPMWAGN